MPRSLFDQDLQIRASITYDDSISGAHDSTNAEGQGNLEEDLNIFRTLMKDLIGETNWYDDPDLTMQEIYDKQFIYLRHESGFDGVTVDGTSTNSFDTSIKGITGHADGGGNSTTTGIVVNDTRNYRLSVRDATSQNAIDDGLGNEVFGRLSWSGTEYIVTFYSNQEGIEVEYDMDDEDIDLAYVAMSAKYQELPWDRFLETSFHDIAGLIGTVTDDVILVDGMSFLLNGLTTQAQVNDKLDKLGSTANGEGASGIAIEDASVWFSGTDVEGALNELESLLGSTTSSTYDFSENNVLTDNDSVYPALEKLDLKWGDLASTDNGEGASLVGVEDSSGYFAGTDVESVLAELYEFVVDVEVQKESETTSGVINSGVNHTLPGSMTYTPASGDNLDVFYQGQLLLEGAANDYQEVAGSPSNQIKFNFTIPTNRNLTYIARK